MQGTTFSFFSYPDVYRSLSGFGTFNCRPDVEEPSCFFKDQVNIFGKFHVKLCDSNVRHERQKLSMSAANERSPI